MGCDPEKLFPYNKFEDQIKIGGLYAIAYAALIMPGLISKREDFPQLDGMTEDDKKFEKLFNNPKYLEKLKDVIEDAADFGWI